MTTKEPPDHLAYELLARAHSPTVATQIFTEKIQHKPLLLRPTSPTLDNRTKRRKERLRKKEHFLKKQKPRPLTAAEKRKTGIYDIPKEAQKYAIYEPLNRMWISYVQEVLGLDGQTSFVNAQSHGSKLASADFHGADLEVSRSRCVSRVGVRGIVVRDTKFTFEIITKSNELKSMSDFYDLDFSALIRDLSDPERAYAFSIPTTQTGCEKVRGDN